MFPILIFKTKWCEESKPAQNLLWLENVTINKILRNGFLLSEEMTIVRKLYSQNKTPT